MISEALQNDKKSLRYRVCKKKQLRKPGISYNIKTKLFSYLSMTGLNISVSESFSPIILCSGPFLTI